MKIEASSETHTDTIKILIVDDDMAMLRLLAHECRLRLASSTEVYTCHESSEAIRLCSSLEIDVLLTDLNMDKVNGFHLLKVAKEKFPLMQVVIITGSDSANAIESALALGADDYFVKPVAASVLVDSVSYMASRMFRWKATIQQLNRRHKALAESKEEDLAMH